MRTSILSLRFFAVLVGIMALCAAPAMADICNDINDVSNGWAAVANALDNSGEVELEDLDIEALEDDVNALLGPTENLGNFLVEEGNEHEEDLGNEILDYVDDLYDTEGDDFVSYLVEIIDDIIGTMDDVVDYCDVVTD